VFLLVYKNKLSEILNSMSRYAFGVCRESPAKNINTRHQFLTGILILSGNENKSNDQNDGRWEFAVFMVITGLELQITVYLCRYCIII